MDERDLPAVGSKLAERYRLAFGRGEGPSGYVFKALDLALDLPVAVKVFRRDLFTSPFREQNLRRLYRARTFQDPAVCRILEVQEDLEGRHFVTSTLMEGMSLRQVIDMHAESGESFALPKIRTYAQRLFDAVLAIHRMGAIHGNIKPENFFIQPDRLVTTDPYHLVARPLADGEQIPVSDYYRGPEQLSQPELELRQSDVYSLALVLGEILAVSPVQPGVPLSAQVPRLTRRLDDLFQRATAMDPALRPATVEEFASQFLLVMAQVETEGLWQRKSHETGSFRAIRIQVGEESGLTPLPVEVAPSRPAVPEPEGPTPAPTVMAAAPAAEPQGAPEPSVTTPAEEVGTPEPEPAPVAEREPAPPSEPLLVAASEPEPETIAVSTVAAVAGAETREEELETVVIPPEVPVETPPTSPVAESVWDEDKTVVTPMVFPVPETPPTPQEPPPVPEEEILELEEEVIEVAGAEEEEVLEEIALEEEEETRPVTARELPPEAPAGTLEMESALPPTPPPPMAPFGRVEGLAGPSKRSKRKAAKIARQAARDSSRATPSPASPTSAPAARIPEPPRPAPAAPVAAPARQSPSAAPPKPPSRAAQKPATAARQGSSRRLVSFLVLLGVAVALGVAGAVLWPQGDEPTIPAEIQPAQPAPKKPASPAPVVAPAATQAPAVEAAPKPAEAPTAASAAEPQKPAEVPAPAPTAEAQKPAEVSAATPAPAPTPPPAPEPPPPPPAPKALAPLLRCPDGMVKIVVDPQAPESAKPSDVAFCMDPYEFPGMGEKPKTGVNLGTAISLCKKAGKRLCTGREFLRACGDTPFDAGICNGSGSLQPSGSFPSCKTPDEVYDLVGNAGEWTSDGQLRGGDATRGGAGSCTYATRRFSPKPTDGFRCCADATR